VNGDDTREAILGRKKLTSSNSKNRALCFSSLFLNLRAGETKVEKTDFGRKKL
jgi:hypothetical protein